MANTNLNVKIINRHGSASEWTTANPLLDNGEIGVETDTHKLKIGDGTTPWTQLSYVQAQAEITKDQILTLLGITEADLLMAMKIAQVTQTVDTSTNDITMKGQINAPSFNDMPEVI